MAQPNVSTRPYLKLVSRVKHRILAKYLAPWSKILGSVHPTLAYVDCFAGAGGFLDELGQPLPGSPVIALQLAKDDVRKDPARRRVLIFAEKDRKTVATLRELCKAEEPLPVGVELDIVQATANDTLSQIVSSFAKVRRNLPTFFFIDPYGHPTSIPDMRRLLGFPQTEILVNLMWYALNMHLNNPNVERNITRLFGHDQWKAQPFMGLSGDAREAAFLDYFVKEMGASYAVPFPVNFSPEDRGGSMSRRTKFYLVHFSSHRLAARLMKEVMFSESDKVGAIGYAGAAGLKATTKEVQGRFDLDVGDPEPDGPDVEQLGRELLQRYAGQERTFETVYVDTLTWPYAEKHYRGELQRLEKVGVVSVTRVESKKSGLKGRDRIRFPPA